MLRNGYTAVIRQDGPWWIGWIEEVSGVNSQGSTRDELLAEVDSCGGIGLAFAIDSPNFLN